MPQLPPAALVAIGAIAAALIAGAFSYLNLVISKEQKVSDFRQAWIDSLREEIAQYCAATVFLSSAYEILEKESLDKLSNLDYLKAIEGQTSKATSAYTSIVLRLNPEDKNKSLRALNIAFLDTLETSRDALRQDNFEVAKSLCDDLQRNARMILKIEWNRVRDGELIFRATRLVALVLIGSALIAGCYFLTRPLTSVVDEPSALPSGAHAPVSP